MFVWGTSHLSDVKWGKASSWRVISFLCAHVGSLEIFLFFILCFPSLFSSILFYFSFPSVFISWLTFSFIPALLFLLTDFHYFLFLCFYSFPFYLLLFFFFLIFAFRSISLFIPICHSFSLRYAAYNRTCFECFWLLRVLSWQRSIQQTLPITRIIAWR